MNAIVGTIAVVIIAGVLCWLDPPEYRVTPAMWLPYIWLLIASSRPLSNWLSLSSPGGFSEAYVDGSPLDRAVLTVLLGLCLYVLSRRWKRAKSILLANAAILIFFGYCLVSLLWCDYPFVSFKRWIRSIGDIAVILVVLTETNWLDAFKWLFTRIAYVLVPLSIVLIRFVPSLGRAYSRGGAPEWTGVGTDKNALGMLCMIYGVALLWQGISIYRTRGSTRTRKLRATVVALLMVLYLLLVVNSQTALACFLMASLLVAMISFGFRNRKLVTLVAVSMLAVSFCVLFLGIGGGALSAIGRDATLTGRTDVWKVVLPYATNSWIGAGYENFWVGQRYQLFQQLLGGLNQAHNGYIEVYLNLGWIGLALLGGVIVAGYRNIMRGLGNRSENSLRLAFFFICLVYNFTEASFKMQSPVWIFFLLAVVALPAPRFRHKAAESRFLPRAEEARATEKGSDVLVGALPNSGLQLRL